MRLVASCVDVGMLLRVLAPASIKEARARHEAYVRDAARERLAQGAVVGDRKDLLSYILSSQGEKGGLSDDEVAANCGFIIMAGSETTATALSGTLYYLLETPDAMRRLKAEVYGTFASEDEIDFVSAGARLPYAHACLTEGLSIYPPGPTAAPRRTPKGSSFTEIDGQMVPPWVSGSFRLFSAARLLY